MKSIELINKKIDKLKKQFISFDYILRGTINKKYLKCGKKQCICHKDPNKLHGPYYHFTKKVKGKTVGKLYSEEEAMFLDKYLKQYNKTIHIIRQISRLSEKATKILLETKKKKEDEV